MAVTRRFLPSTTLLCAFEAAARLNSFTAAAEELTLTQSAVSRQIRALEALLGSDLFVRDRQTVRLTSAGQAYAREIRAAIGHITSATLAFRANPRGGTLNLAILPTFGTRWLAPRLPGFVAAHPGITVNLSTRFAPFDFGAESIDAAIHFGRPDWAGADLMPLMGETVVPAFGPALRDAVPIRTPADLLGAPLLHLASRPDAWERWFHAKGMAADEVHGMLLDQFATAAQAAMAGIGVALLPRFLIAAELARGDLVTLPGGELRSEERYYLAWPAGRADDPPLEAFRDWIAGEVEGFEA